MYLFAKSNLWQKQKEVQEFQEKSLLVKEKVELQRNLTTNIVQDQKLTEDKDVNLYKS